MTSPSSPSGEAVHESVSRATKDDFEAWLRKGLGRAAILLRDKPDDADLNALLLDACIENWAYDRQCEEGRAPYLSGLIRITGRAAAYRAALEASLKAAASGEPIDNVMQVFGILCRLTEQDDADQTWLRDFVLTTENRALALDGAWELVRLQGLDALLACVRRFGAEIVEDPWILTSITHELEERDGAASAATALAQARRDDPELCRLLGLAEVSARRVRPPTDVPTYAALRAEVEHGVRRHFPRIWVLGAHPTEIEQVVADLLSEPDEAKVRAYLSVFRHRAFPGDPTRLFPLLASANKRVAGAAARALALTCDPVVRSFGLQLVADGQPALGLWLLFSNYRDDDLMLIRSELHQLSADPDTHHHISFAVLDMIRDMTAPSDTARTIVLDIYEDGPCSLCRGRVVDRLASMNGIPDWLPTEGRYDAEPSIVAHFAPSVPADQ